jgi:DNA-binding transcriptional MerR regulator
MKTGDVARECGVSADTIRYYERRGAIASERAANGYRSYPAETVRRVGVIRRALAIGFSLDDIVGFLRERREGHPPCRRVRAAAQTKLAEIDGRIAEMIAFREQLADILRDWDTRLLAGEPARLLEALPTGQAPAMKAVPGHRSPNYKETS